MSFLIGGGLTAGCLAGLTGFAGLALIFGSSSLGVFEGTTGLAVSFTSTTLSSFGTVFFACSASTEFGASLRLCCSAGTAGSGSATVSCLDTLAAAGTESFSAGACERVRVTVAFE